MFAFFFTSGMHPNKFSLFSRLLTNFLDKSESDSIRTHIHFSRYYSRKIHNLYALLYSIPFTSGGMII